MKLFTFIPLRFLHFNIFHSLRKMHIPCQQSAALRPGARLIDHFGRLGLAENIQFVRRHIRFAVCQIMFIPATAAQTTTLRE